MTIQVAFSIVFVSIYATPVLRLESKAFWLTSPAQSGQHRHIIIFVLPFSKDGCHGGDSERMTVGVRLGPLFEAAVDRDVLKTFGWAGS
jgi:hypothetical protein